MSQRTIFGALTIEGLQRLVNENRLDLPQLWDFGILEIDSTLPLDCGPLDDVFKPIAEQWSETMSGPHRLYRCELTLEKKNSRLSTGVKAAIGVVVGVVGSTIVGLGFWWWKRSANSKPKGFGEVELSSLTGLADQPVQREPLQGDETAEQLPAYSARG
ncbi:hypothetical protein BDV12DRAFT_203472 [Aspergillus spectabilis]